MLITSKDNQKTLTSYTHFSSNVKKKIKFDEKYFNDYLEIFIFLIKQGEKRFKKSMNVFPPSKSFYIKYLLENKFERYFSLREIKEIINDKSWQVSTRSQAEDIISERTET